LHNTTTTQQVDPQPPQKNPALSWPTARPEPTICAPPTPLLIKKKEEKKEKKEKKPKKEHEEIRRAR
jgi:hypothetical protein